MLHCWWSVWLSFFLIHWKRSVLLYYFYIHGSWEKCFKTEPSYQFNTTRLWSEVKRSLTSEIFLSKIGNALWVDFHWTHSQQQFCMRTNNITDQTVGNMPTYICQIINLIPDGPNRTPKRQKRFHWLDIFCWANWWNIKLILILQAFPIFFQGLVVSKLSFSSIMLVFVFQIKLNKNLNSQLLSHHSILSHTFEL